MGRRHGLGLLAHVRRPRGAAGARGRLPVVRLDRHGRRSLRERPPRGLGEQPVPPLALRGEETSPGRRERGRGSHQVAAPRGACGAPRARAGARSEPDERQLGPRDPLHPQVPVLGRLGLGRLAPRLRALRRGGARPRLRALRRGGARPRRRRAARLRLDRPDAPSRRVPRRRHGALRPGPGRAPRRARRGDGRLRRRDAHAARARPRRRRAVRAEGVVHDRQAAPLVAERLRRAAALSALRCRRRDADRSPDRAAPDRGRPHAGQSRRALRAPRERRPRLREGRGLDPVRRETPPRDRGARRRPATTSATVSASSSGTT